MVTVVAQGNARPVPDAVATTLLHIAREALSNVLKHAHAARAELRLENDEAGITLTIADDGDGFDPAEPREDEHHGLRNMRARASRSR